MTINRTHLAGLELAKEILGGYTADQVSDSPYIAITDAIAQAQAAPEAEPVATIQWNRPDCDWKLTMLCEPAHPEGVALNLYEAPQHDADHVEHPRAMVDAELVELRGLRPVLAMILNALDRDAAEGKAARGEMAEELRAKLATLSTKP